MENTYCAYHVKIYTGPERAKAWTASGQSGVPVSFFFVTNRLCISRLKKSCPSRRLALRMWGLLGKTGSSYLP